jgi:anti-anti-sigma factor
MQIVLEPGAGGAVVARVRGRLDFHSAQEAGAQFNQAIADGRGKLIVDLSKVDFVDSAGLGALIGGMRRARQAGGDLYVAAPTEQVKTLLSLTLVDQIMKIHPTVSEALRDFSR